MTKKKKKMEFSRVLMYACLIIASLIVVIPIIVVLFGSFKTHDEFYSTGVMSLPQNFLYFDNYIAVFREGNMMLGFFNTIIIVVASVFATVMTGTMTAYILDRFKFKGNNLIKNLFLIASLIPSITMQMSIFQIISKLHLFNTRLAVVLLFAGTDIISIYIFMQFLGSISKTLDESAIMDGASYPRVYWSIIMPLLKPAIVTVIILKGVGFYNEFYTPFLYMPRSNLAVISTALFKFKGPYGAKWEFICAGIIITIIPIFIIFLAMQKQIYSGMTQGSVKE